MKIGVMGAMDQEIALIKASMQDLNQEQRAHLTFYTGTINGVEVVLVRCGIGKVAAAVATTMLIDHFTPDYIVNTGSAGGLDPTLDIGDMVIAEAVLHHDVDLTHFNYAPGQCAGMPATYTSHPTLVEAAQQAAATLTHVTTKRGVIGTGDAFIGCDQASATLKQRFADLLAVEMEGAAIGQTCHMMQVPFVVIRSLSDVANKESSETFQTYIDKAGKHSAQLVLGMIERLPR